jgi:hypothetical protein
MNEIMKTLTIVSAIFIPLTFIAGLRNEFSAYRTSISKWLLCYRGYGSNWDYYGVLFQKEKMVLNRVVIIERIICRKTMQSNRIP